MTVQTLYTAATGMEALETKLDVIANNMANINTTGFQEGPGQLRRHLLSPVSLAGCRRTPTATCTATGIEVGLGTRVSSTQTNYKQGAFETTNNPLDLAIEGDGFFQVDNPNGDFYYTRAGNFDINANGQIVLGSASNGYLLEPNITVPPEATGIVISSDGTVKYSSQDRPTLQTTRADSAGEVHQPGRPAEAGRQPVSAERTRRAIRSSTPLDRTATATSGKVSWKRRMSSR